MHMVKSRTTWNSYSMKKNKIVLPRFNNLNNIENKDQKRKSSLLKERGLAKRETILLFPTETEILLPAVDNSKLPHLCKSLKLKDILPENKKTEKKKDLTNSIQFNPHDIDWYGSFIRNEENKFDFFDKDKDGNIIL